MHYSVENLTSPGEDIADGDKYRAYFTSAMTSWEDLIYREPASDEDIAAREARQWRDSELTSTDTASQTPDWPNRDAVLTYRAALRDWPSTEDFPATKPEIG